MANFYLWPLSVESSLPPQRLAALPSLPHQHLILSPVYLEFFHLFWFPVFLLSSKFNYKHGGEI